MKASFPTAQTIHLHYTTNTPLTLQFSLLAILTLGTLQNAFASPFTPNSDLVVGRQVIGEYKLLCEECIKAGFYCDASGKVQFHDTLPESLGWCLGCYCANSNCQIA
ncbi:hypothetical protein QBC41DRAFT_341110 [Cercophora samala]|uniref:Uncharacterized protein n=1 Tax=Cercophora samala TaxID=330535 RepID=A0AA40D2P0_9PEZI|nr:hypothetical protein QBC41DRAFT_341110 [Cercophora samala]